MLLNALEVLCNVEILHCFNPELLNLKILNLQVKVS